MGRESMLAKLNRMGIMIFLGIFIVAELLYLAPEYKFGLGEACRLVAMMLK